MVVVFEMVLVSFSFKFYFTTIQEFEKVVSLKIKNLYFESFYKCESKIQKTFMRFECLS